MEKLDVLAYMVENGYVLPRPMDEMAASATLEELWQLCQAFLEQEDTQD